MSYGHAAAIQIPRPRERKVGYFDETPWRGPRDPLPKEQAAYYRDALREHANNPETGKCPICHIGACSDWRDAYDQLAKAGELMRETDVWDTK